MRKLNGNAFFHAPYTLSMCNDDQIWLASLPRLHWTGHFSSVEWHVLNIEWERKRERKSKNRTDWSVYILVNTSRNSISINRFYEILVFFKWPLFACGLNGRKVIHMNWNMRIWSEPQKTTKQKTVSVDWWEQINCGTFKNCYFKRGTRVITLSMAFGTFIVELWSEMQWPRPRKITLFVYFLQMKQQRVPIERQQRRDIN